MFSAKIPNILCPIRFLKFKYWYIFCNLFTYNLNLYNAISKAVWQQRNFRNNKRFLKGMFAKNERGHRLTAINNRFWSLPIFLLSIASIMRKLLKTSHTEERRFLTNSESWFCYDSDRNKINLIPSKAFRYYNL